MSTILITGAGGYIGSIATQLFLKRGYRVVGIDAFLTGYPEPLELLKSQFPETFTWYEVNIADAGALDEVFTKHPDIKAVVHYAASCVVKESMEQPEKYFQNNVHGSLQLLEAMRRHKVRNIVFSSTCAVYGEIEYHPIDEKHPMRPTNPYGESKLMVEQMLSWYEKIHGFNTIIMRYFNVYGTSEDMQLGYAKKPCTHLIDAAVQGALGLHTFALTCSNTFPTPDGTPIRDYLHVLDLNEAHVSAIEMLLAAQTPVWQAFNLGTGSGNTVLEMVKIVEEETGTNLPHTFGEVRLGEDAKLVADNTKAKAILGWEPRRSIRESIPAMITWYKSHPKGWKT